MLAVIAHGDDAYRLLDVTGRDVGWVQSKTIGFGGFDSESAAHAAAVDGARALVRCLKQEFGVTHMELSDRPNARAVRFGGAEWIADGRVRIARLLRTPSDIGDGEDLAIEFDLPRYANHAVAINAALIVYGALSRELAATSVSRSFGPAYAAPE
jgi:hypothetical protein